MAVIILSNVVHNLPAYLFHQGTNYKTYEYLGAHKENGHYVFRVWAPNADAVYLVGDFNFWTEDAPMYRVTDGIWEYIDNNPARWQEDTVPRRGA